MENENAGEGGGGGEDVWGDAECWAGAFAGAGVGKGFANCWVSSIEVCDQVGARAESGRRWVIFFSFNVWMAKSEEI